MSHAELEDLLQLPEKSDILILAAIRNTEKVWQAPGSAMSDEDFAFPQFVVDFLHGSAEFEEYERWHASNRFHTQASGVLLVLPYALFDVLPRFSWMAWAAQRALHRAESHNARASRTATEVLNRVKHVRMPDPVTGTKARHSVHFRESPGNYHVLISFPDQVDTGFPLIRQVVGIRFVDDEKNSPRQCIGDEAYADY